jgi:hypothetical protein
MVPFELPAGRGESGVRRGAEPSQTMPKPTYVFPSQIYGTCAGMPEPRGTQDRQFGVRTMQG